MRNTKDPSGHPATFYAPSWPTCLTWLASAPAQKAKQLFKLLVEFFVACGKSFIIKKTKYIFAGNISDDNWPGKQ
jgi:hypothetical protein